MIPAHSSAALQGCLGLSKASGFEPGFVLPEIIGCEQPWSESTHTGVAQHCQGSAPSIWGELVWRHCLLLQALSVADGASSRQPSRTQWAKQQVMKRLLPLSSSYDAMDC